MYNDFYQFKLTPFDVTLDPRFLYLSKNHRELLTDLIDGINERRGIITVVGEEGAGKTTLLSYLLNLLNQLDENTKAAFFSNTNLEFEQLLDMIFIELGVGKAGERFTKIEKIRYFYEVALQQLANGGNVVVIMDEAQKLDHHLIEDLRLLSNLETPKHKLFQFIFAGSPEFDVKLNQEDMQPFAKRIALRHYITSFSEEETSKYIQHRLFVAGHKDNSIFSQSACRLIWRYSGGIPRKVNMLCDHVLMVGYRKKKKTIDATLMKEAIDDQNWNALSISDNSLFIREDRPPETDIGRSRALFTFAASLTVGICLVFAFLFYGNVEQTIEKAKSLGDLVAAKIQNMSMNKPITYDKPAQDELVDVPSRTGTPDQGSSTVTSLVLPTLEINKAEVGAVHDQVADRENSTDLLMEMDKQSPSMHFPDAPIRRGKDANAREEVPSARKNGNHAMIIEPDYKEFKQDGFGDTTSNGSEKTMTIIGQSLDQKKITKAQEIGINTLRPLGPSTMQRLLDNARRKWGKAVFVRKGENLSSLIRRVYGESHSSLIEAVMEANRELKSSPLKEGQAIRLPKFYKPGSTRKKPTFVNNPRSDKIR